MKSFILLLLALPLVTPGIVRAQVPSGAITGVVTDSTGARLPGASVIITNKETGSNRNLVTSGTGIYSASALLPGLYEVTADAHGFKRLEREATVESARTTDVNMVMQVGAKTETLTVEGASAQIHYESHQIDGMIARPQIEGLPLNGRNFLELAKLEPGAQQPTRASTNRILVPLLSSPVAQNGRATRVTVDGGSIMEVGNGGSAMGFSQEAVEEFQVSTVNFDLSTGATASGAVNVATRSGTNQLHGSGFLFFRDHHLSAYPALHRDAFNPDPFFQRKQFGLSLGGPIRKDRVFFFGSFERLDQRGVVSNELLTPEFAPLSGIFPSPTYGNQFSGRTDFKLSENQLMFVRYSHEGTFAFAPGGAYPSTWPRQTGWADQSILGLTSQLGPGLVNEVRFSYFFVSFVQHLPEAADCPRCLGMGAPSITVGDDLSVGISSTTAVLGRRYHLNDAVSWQEGLHHIRFGGDWETSRGGRTNLNDEPVTMDLYSPSEVADFNAQQPAGSQIPLPATFLTLQDILQLPLRNFTVGIGDPFVPQAGFGKARVSPLIHLFYEDSWRLHPRFVVKYGLGWTYDGSLNHDLRKPAYLAAVLGASDLAPTRKNWKQFSPSFGFAWNLRDNGKTVIRGGLGIYRDFQTSFPISDVERVSLGPRGVGRGSYFSGGIGNPLTDVPGVPQGTLLDLVNPTMFTGAAAMQALPPIRANLAHLRGDPNNRDFSVTNIEADKQGSVNASNFPNFSATHVSLGVQREVARDLVVSADFVVRRFRNLYGGLIDANHFTSVRGPVLQVCSETQQSDPKALCSLGPITLTSPIFGATYHGLLVRAEKRLSHGSQFLASYAYSSNVGDNFSNGYDADHPLENKGPLDRDIRHILSLSGLAQLPKRFQVGLFVSYISKPPFSVFLGDFDLNGDGLGGDLLPGTRVNQFNRGLGKRDLLRLVDEFNRTYAGGQDAWGNVIPPITLPSKFEFGDAFLTQDLRLSRDFIWRERWRMTLIGEAFNLFNIGNLSGRSGNLFSHGFGRPTGRVTQVFGSGGPRAFQVAARVSF
jgi:carboxypeptidase family protein